MWDTIKDELGMGERKRRTKRKSGGKKRKGTRKTARAGTPKLHKLVVTKPFCAPSRPIIKAALENHGVKIYRFEEHVKQSQMKDFARRMKVEGKQWENLKYGPASAMWLPMAWVATVYVSKDQANWADYLLERTGKLVVIKGRGDKRNRQWADQHGGKMPTPWEDPSCKEGQQIQADWDKMKEADDN